MRAPAQARPPREAIRCPPDVIAILGPTAVGKTPVAVTVARCLGGEIISSDSRQAYRGLQIGTAAPTPAEMDAAPHHGVGFLEPGERYGAGRFARLARGWIGEIRDRGAVPIVVGGTGFFFRALTDPVFQEPDLDEGRRARLESWLADRTIEELQRWTEKLDPAIQDRLGVLDRQRTGRALEMALLTGRNLDWWHLNSPPEAPPVRARIWVLELDSESLRERIGARTERLLGEGWLDEVETLVRAGHSGSSPAMSSIGYRHVLDLAQGRISREAAVQAILRDTWRYGRRQRTWFRHQLPPDAVRVDAGEGYDRLAARIVADWRDITTRATERSALREAARPEAEKP